MDGQKGCFYVVFFFQFAGFVSAMIYDTFTPQKTEERKEQALLRTLSTSPHTPSGNFLSFRLASFVPIFSTRVLLVVRNLLGQNNISSSHEKRPTLVFNWFSFQSDYHSTFLSPAVLLLACPISNRRKHVFEHVTRRLAFFDVFFGKGLGQRGRAAMSSPAYLL